MLTAGWAGGPARCIVDRAVATARLLSDGAGVSEHALGHVLVAAGLNRSALLGPQIRLSRIVALSPPTTSPGERGNAPIHTNAVTTGTRAGASAQVRRTGFDAAVVDLLVPGAGRIDLLERLQRLGRPVPTVSSDWQWSWCVDSRAQTLGAVVLFKPHSPDWLVTTLTSAQPGGRAT
jgi:hypothetical protein